MNQTEMVERIANTGILAEIGGIHGEGAAESMGRLLAGGVQVVTVSVKQEGAADVLGALAAAYPQAILGAANVTNLEEGRLAVRAGAKLLVTAGLESALADWCAGAGVPMIPTCVTPREMMLAANAGFCLQAVLPAYGGAAALRGAASMFPGVKWIVTGADAPDDLQAYAALSCVAAVGCRWIWTEKTSAASIETNARQAILAMLGFALFHVGINSADAREARETARALSDAFGFEVAEGPGAYYASTGLKRIDETLIDPKGEIAASMPGAFYVTTDFEVMKKNYLGKNGHLAIATNSIERAMAYLEQKGYPADMATAYRKGDRFFTVYLRGEFGGFAVHLFQK